MRSTILLFFTPTAEGVPKSDVEALKWHQAAAAQGNIASQLGVANTYEEGRGVPQSYAQALYWYRKAAAQGGVVAEVVLGMMHEQGRGVAQNYAEARKCILKLLTKTMLRHKRDLALCTSWAEVLRTTAKLPSGSARRQIRTTSWQSLS
jgi:hypothetical protein